MSGTRRPDAGAVTNGAGTVAEGASAVAERAGVVAEGAGEGVAAADGRGRERPDGSLERPDDVRERPDGLLTGPRLLAIMTDTRCGLPECAGRLARGIYEGTDAVVCRECGVPAARIRGESP